MALTLYDGHKVNGVGRGEVDWTNWDLTAKKDGLKGWYDIRCFLIDKYRQDINWVGGCFVSEVCADIRTGSILGHDEDDDEVLK